MEYTGHQGGQQQRYLHGVPSLEFPTLNYSESIVAGQRYQNTDVWKPKNDNRNRRNEEKSWSVNRQRDSNNNHSYSSHLNHSRPNNNHYNRQVEQRRSSIEPIYISKTEGDYREEEAFSFINIRCSSNNEERDNNNGNQNINNRSSFASEGRRRNSINGKDHNSNLRVGSHTRSTRRDSDAAADSVEGQQSVNETEEIRKLKPMKLQFWRTKMCPWVTSLGNCRKGANCRYAHSQDELRPLPDLSKTKMCDEFVKTGSCSAKRAFCKYAHSVEELRATASFSKTKLCPLWLQGICTSGVDCRFAHGENELRTTAVLLDQFNSPMLDQSTDSPNSRSSEKVSSDAGDDEIAKTYGRLQVHKEADRDGNVGHTYKPTGYPSMVANAMVTTSRENTVVTNQFAPFERDREERSGYLIINNELINSKINYESGPNQQRGSPMRSVDSTKYLASSHYPITASTSEGTLHPVSISDQIKAQMPQGTIGIPAISVTTPPRDGGWTGQAADPTMFFQGLSPMSLRVATNALVYLSEMQWPPQNQPQMTSSVGDFSTNNRRTQATDAAAMPPQVASAVPCQMIYPSSPTVRRPHWGANIGAGQSIGTMSTPQIPSTTSGSPVRYFGSSLGVSATGTPVARPPGFSPISNPTIEQAGETGRFVTHLLPSGMFSPMTQRSFRSAVTAQGQMNGSPPPVDLFLSFPPQPADTHSQPSNSDRSLLNLSGSDQSSTSTDNNRGSMQRNSHVASQYLKDAAPSMIALQASNLPPDTPNPMHSAQFISNQSGQVLTWNTNPAGQQQYLTPCIFSPDSSPGMFLSSSSTTHPASTPFPSPVLSTAQPTAQPSGLNGPCLSPASYTTALSFSNGIASPTAAILTTLNLLPAPQQAPVNTGGISIMNTEFPAAESDATMLPGFPLLAFLANANFTTDRRSLANQNDKPIQGTTTISTQYEPKTATFIHNPPYQSQPIISLSEHSPSLLSSKSSPERSSTGSPSRAHQETDPSQKVLSKHVVAQNESSHAL